jgi:Glycosyl transferase family 2
MTAPAVSIVVEWDNVRLSGASRALTMLSRLRDEVAAQDGGAIEVLLMHDGRVGDLAEAERILGPVVGRIRSLRAPDAGYYELKNAGAGEATGELIVFLDCDVIPEPGWLREIVASFAAPEVAVVAGATYLDPDTFSGRLLAHTFVFPPRGARGPIGRRNRFFANNVAFRRETARAFPFPDVPGSARASCVALARQLADAGVVVVANHAARVGHPAPSGVWETARRAFLHGRDTAVLADAGTGPSATLAAGTRRVGQLVRSIVRDRRQLELPWVATPVAVLAACAYYAVAATGVAFARVAPGAARRLEL